ncbi:MAG: tRNA 2-thiouridine(34) synthase MnmA [Bdellovibrionales bacterium]|nr:tRNA 2-thiouridine(34) synthase MnmA [Bdellovibrionales bacterium]NQZ18382.1 tRNA 2-thiouridine(34) synthase MnmA [Bdellovibrionales bacterium]
MASKGRVLVAMSGGVDSSVAAALLVEQGYEVIGVTMQVWDYTQCNIDEGTGTCCSSEDVDDARAVADRLDIPFYVLNCEDEFKEKVIDPFVNSYMEGKTPLPCVNCNTYLKFDHLIDKMKELSCDYLATGHYATLKENEKGQWGIVTSADSWKDQTYFLFTLEKEVIPKLIFPVGEMTKKEVRDYAEKNDLVVARKKDSVGICFVDKDGYGEFINTNYPQLEAKKGKMRRYPSGEVLREHEGIHYYTYGQRKGLGISAECPLYVLKVDAETHEVWVGEEEYLFSEEMIIKDCHWLEELDQETFDVKIRYSHKGAEARFEKLEDGNLKVIFSEKQRAITPGQAAVFYKDQRLVGGGWIQ